MTWRLLIFFSLAFELASAGQVHGHISIQEAIHGNIRNVSPAGTVIWLEPVDSADADLNIGKSLAHYSIVQKNKSFSPHILAIPVGSTVDFPNSDPIFHNAFSNYDGQIFDIGLYPPGSSRSVKFLRPGIVRIFCNIHSSMSAVIIVLRTPFFTTAPADGTFSMDGVPDGKYRLALYSEHATEKALDTQRRTINISGGNLDLGSITLAGSSFLNIPHLNKYGKEYQPLPASGVYMGAKP